MYRMFHHWMMTRVCWFLVLQLVLPCCAAMARQEPAVIDLTVGFNGAYKVGFWTPVKVQVEGIDPETDVSVAITVPDGDGLPTRYVMTKDGSCVHSDKIAEYLLCVKFGRVHGNLTVRVMVDQHVAVSRTFLPGEFPAALPADQQLVVHLGAEAGVEEASQILQQKNVHVSQLEQGVRLPDHWWCYEGIDTLVITTGSGNLADWVSMDQVKAMLHWIRMGGQMILSVGRQGEQLLGVGGLLAEFVPGEFEEVVEQCQTVGLENFTDVAQPVGVHRDTEGRCELDLALIARPLGKVEVLERRAEGTCPVVIRHCMGFGQLVLVTVDLDLPPLVDWAGRNRFLGRLLEWTLGKVHFQQRTSAVGALRHTGYTDLAGQLRSAMDHFSTITFIPFWFVATLVVVYVLLIGPADYIFLKHGLRRMEWTWLTFPLIITGFCVVAYALAYRLKGTEIQINQVDIVDVDGRDGFLRGTTWSHAISPATETYDLAFELAIPGELNSTGDCEVLLSWQGLPGDVLGGMNSISTAETLLEGYTIHGPTSHISSKSEIVGLPMQIWSTKALQTRWWLDGDLGSLGQIQATPDGQIRGQVHNPLQVDLDDCCLYYKPWAYQLGKISSQGTILVGTGTDRRNLHWRLTRRSLSEASDIITPWDQYSREIPRIIEMMMFHSAAGGEKYTGLLNRYQSFVDMSSHLNVGEAVLIGRTNQAATNLRLDGESLEKCYDQRWAFYRFVIPVEPAVPARVSRDVSRSELLSRN